MRYILWGIMSFLALSCTQPSTEVCNTTEDAPTLQVVKTTTSLIAKSRNATVRILSIGPDDNISIGTGTAFKYKGHTIVVTAAHVINGPPWLVGVESLGESTMAQVVYYDAHNDLAVLLPSNHSNLKPVKFRPIKPASIKIGQNTLYSGYPNDEAMYTIKGYISAINREGNYYMHAYAWRGASGSGVFDEWGRLIGVLTAVGVGTDVIGTPTAIEDVVHIVPIWKLMTDLLDFNLESLDE